MRRNKTFQKKKILLVFLAFVFLLAALLFRLVYLMVFRSEYYTGKADDLHEREREIKAARGRILDRNGVVLAANRTVCTISVVHSQIEDAEAVIEVLSSALDMEEDTVRERVEKESSMERIRSNVAKETGDAIRALGLAGVKVDEDSRRTYPYGSLASRLLGFTGSDNQGILGLEAAYDEILAGTPGKILTITDARGIEQNGLGETREDPTDGYDLVTSLDYTIQTYAQQEAERVLEEKQADAVAILILDPRNGEIRACVNAPEYDLNHPYELPDGEDESTLSQEEYEDALNQMWRNLCVSDTYEPGSIFKIVTAAAALEEGAVTLDEAFYCPGYRVVKDRKIRCARRTGHGAQSFLEAVENSCNPVFIDVALRLGATTFYDYMEQFGLMEKTGVDVPGEAGIITHAEEKVGEVELATMAFGQSFQITPIRLMATAAALINGGTSVTPHFGVEIRGQSGELIKTLGQETEERVVSAETSEKLVYALEMVVEEGGGTNGQVEGYRVGGKTATSQTLPRAANRYISSFLCFAPAEDPSLLGICVIYNPQGQYYGGLVAAPVMQRIFENILPYEEERSKGE